MKDIEISGYYGIDVSLLEVPKYKYFVKWYLDGAKKKNLKNGITYLIICNLH
ncbi:MAG: hypothetical protein ACLS28_07680 [Clostridium neonatale]